MLIINLRTKHLLTGEDELGLHFTNRSGGSSELITNKCKIITLDGAVIYYDKSEEHRFTHGSSRNVVSKADLDALFRNQAGNITIRAVADDL